MDTSILTAAGFECTHYPEQWADVGNCESGPKLIGSSEYDCWSNGTYYLCIADGKIFDTGLEIPPEYRCHDFV